MKKQEAKRDFNMSDAELKQDADTLIRNVQRDSAKFATRGVTTATVTVLMNQSIAFGDIPTDVELLGDLETATTDKNTAAENLKVSLRTIRTMAVNKFEESNPKYKKFGFEGMDKLDDNELYRLGKRVIRVANKVLTELASEGLTTAMLTATGALVTVFDNTIDAKADAESDRIHKTQERIEAGNMLYKEMVRLCNIGKDLFVSTDAARYNDYVIYDTPQASASKVEPPATPPV